MALNSTSDIGLNQKVQAMLTDLMILVEKRDRVLPLY